MTFRKILATAALVGVMGTAAFANDINFTQSGGAIGAVNFVQFGNTNFISANGNTAAAAARVTGSLDTLKLEQIGNSNKASFAITTDSASVGDVAVVLYGHDNTSTLAVTQGAGATLDYSVGIKGSNNSVVSTITAKSSVVNIESIGHNIAYDIDQIGGVANTNAHSITAMVSKTGTDLASITLDQSGLSNTITMGAPSPFSAFYGTGGLTLNGDAVVTITQGSAAATYTAESHTIAAAGSLTVMQY